MNSTTEQELQSLLPELSSEQLERILEFARFLQWQQERVEWKEFGKKTTRTRLFR